MNIPKLAHYVMNSGFDKDLLTFTARETVRLHIGMPEPLTLRPGQQLFLDEDTLLMLKDAEDAEPWLCFDLASISTAEFPDRKRRAPAGSSTWKK